MGYGYLFVGYVFAFVLSLVPHGWSFALVGCLLMGRAAVLLREYYESYKFSLLADCLLVSLNVLRGIADVGAVLGLEEQTQAALSSIADGAMPVTVFAFNLALLYSLRETASDVKLDEKKHTVYLNFAIVAAENVLYAAAIAYAPLTVFQYLAQIVRIITFSVMLFGFYMRVCPENDADMTAKPSRSRIFNRAREELDRGEKKAARAIESQIRRDREKRLDDEQKSGASRGKKRK